MAITPIVIAPIELPRSALQQCRDLCQTLANTYKEPVALAMVEIDAYEHIRAYLEGLGGDGYRKPLQLVEPASAQAMSSAPFVYRADGSPDWGAMWTSFCDLALYGGPPPRGEESALTAPGGFGERPAEFDAIAEIQRGIAETTGLVAEPAEPGWVAVTCHSPKMAAWLCATILLENVEAGCRGDRLLLPASWEFGLKDEVKSVITVLAKTNHYWQAHVVAAESGGRGA